MSRAVLVISSDDIRQKACDHCSKAFSKDPRYSKRYFARQRFCSQECAGKAWRDEAAANRPAIKDALFAKADIQPASECWQWMGSTDKDGYGVFSYERKTLKAHRVALELSGVHVEKGQFVCHTCDNPKCINPAHLYVGTPQRNVADKVERQRQPKGEGIHAAKLTSDAVLAIRASGETDEALSRRYGVSRSAVTLARNGTTWRHVT
jgi:hypothetical protein